MTGIALAMFLWCLAMMAAFAVIWWFIEWLGD